MRRNDGRRQTGLGDSFDAYCDHCNITAEGQEYIRSVRRDMIWECGTRRVPQGGFRSEEAGVVIAVGPCTLALGIALESEFSKNAIEYFPNPPTLRFPDLRPRKKQAMLSVNPEFLLPKADRAAFVEWKTEDRLQALATKHPWHYQRAEDGRWTCPSIDSAAVKLGLTYELQNAAQINRHLLCWAGWLLPHYDHRFKVSRAKVTLVRGIVADRWLMTLADLRADLTRAISENELQKAMSDQRRERRNRRNA